METQKENEVIQKEPVQSANSGTSMKDFMIPLSIVIAGIIIGGGLYFNGGSADSQQPATAPTETADKTENIDPLTADDHIKGDLNAKIKVVEYSDFDCPFCSRFHDTMNEIVEESNGEVAWVYRQFPLEQLHPQAPAVALASECVAELGGNDAFWTFADGYFASRGAREQIAHADLIPRLVLEAGLSQSSFTECFDSERLNDLVQADMDDAVETGGRGTPWSIIIGPSGKTYPVSGALPKQSIEQLIKVAIEEA